MAVSLTAAETLALLGTQDQEKVMMMEPKEEKQTWECETRLHGNHSSSQEIFCQRFRQLCYQEAAGPREALSWLRVLCCERLRPESYSKEQMLELLVLKEFLTILPKELQSQVWGHHPKSGEKAVTVLEDSWKDSMNQDPRWKGEHLICCGNQINELPAWRRGSSRGSCQVQNWLGPSRTLSVCFCLFCLQALNETLALLPAPVLWGGSLKSPWKLWSHRNQVVPDHPQVPGLACGPAWEEWWEKAALGAAQEKPSFQLQPMEPWPFPESAE